MTQTQRNAAIDALSDILLARAASRHRGGGGGGGGGLGGTIKIDPRLNKPEPTGGGGSKTQVNDPQGILNQRNKTPVAMPDAPTNTPTDQSDPGTPQPEKGSDPGQGPGPGGGDIGDPGQPGGPEQEGSTTAKTKQTDQGALSADYRNAWNNIITRFDRDEISKDQLLELITRIQNGELEI